MTSLISENDGTPRGLGQSGGLGEGGAELILKTDGRGRVRVPAGKRAEILAAVDRSGMSGVAFARDVAGDLWGLAGLAAQHFRVFPGDMNTNQSLPDSERTAAISSSRKILSYKMPDESLREEK